MDYSKLNKIDVDGNGNIVIQDVSGCNVTINYNDADTLKTLIETITEMQSFELKQLIGNQHKDILSEIRKIQEKLDEQNTNHKADEASQDVDEFMKQMKAMKIDGVKKRLMTNYKLLREYEELYVLEDDPRRKMKYEREIETIKVQIEKLEVELVG